MGSRVVVEIVPSWVGELCAGQYAASLVIDGCVAVDAGCVGFWGPPQRQSAIRHVLLSHSHIDHVASLPIFLDNVHEASAGPVVIHCSPVVADSLRRDLFNDRVWPDLFRIGRESTPFFEMRLLEPEVPIQVAGLHITPVEVHHAVPTLGFIVSDERGTVVIASDTGPTSRIWELARQARDLRGVFLEVTFPNRLSRLAETTGHLTPAMFAREIEKLGQAVRIIVVHTKARFSAEVFQEMADLGRTDLELGVGGNGYRFE